ncbi:MAG: sugar ABC transporter permease [Lachnospiraceae bacterium]|nr:sugar ABC transporter permease [Lachnospiraceae bacterium]
MEKKKQNLFGTNIRQNGMIIALVVILIFFGIITQGVMYRPMNISNLFMQNSYVIFLAIGMFFCILTGNVDLSVGSVVAVAGAMLGYMVVQEGIPTPTAIVITLVAGILIGVFQGSFIAFLNVPPFIVTLAGMLMFRGLTMVILRGQSLSPFSKGFQYFASGFVLTEFRLAGINVICLLLIIVSAVVVIWSEIRKRNNRIKYGFEVSSQGMMIAKIVVVLMAIGAVTLGLSAYRGMPFILSVLIVVTLIYTFIANKTPLGRHVYAVGGNKNAANLSGVRTKLVMLLVYINCAFMATIAGIVVTGRLNVATAKAGNSYELDAIAACYIGGCSASGGAGTIIGVIIGAAVMGVLNNGMSILGIGTDMQQVIKGLILLLAVTFDIYSKSKSSKQ